MAAMKEVSFLQGSGPWEAAHTLQDVPVSVHTASAALSGLGGVIF